MSDLLAGTTVLALDTPPTVSNDQPDGYTFNATTYGIDADSGTYIDCGVAFVACTTGRAVIHWAASMANDTAAGVTFVAPVVRTGSTVGAGASVLSADDDEAIRITGTVQYRFGAHLFVSGLTAGSSYNVRLEHRVQGAVIGSLNRRRVTVTPAT